MSQPFIISVICPDRPGLIAALAERLFELGANLGDAAFAVLGRGAEFTAACTLPAGVGGAEIDSALRALPETRDGEISVRAFAFAAEQDDSGRTTHLIEVGGGDCPGLVARLGSGLIKVRSRRGGVPR